MEKQSIEIKDLNHFLKKLPALSKSERASFEEDIKKIKEEKPISLENAVES